MISILIPVVRPQNMPDLVQAIHDNAGISRNEYEIVFSEDIERAGCPEMLKRLVSQSSGDMVCFVGDDTAPGHEFLKHALNSMAGLPNGCGVIGLNSQPSRHAAHFLASRKMLDILPDGMFFHTDYKHCFCDHELTDIAIEAGQYAFCEKAILKHNHPVFNAGPVDEDYIRVYSEDFRKHDQRTYWRRKRERYGFKLGIGFPITDKSVHLDFMLSFLTLEKPDYTLLIPRFPVGDFIRDIAAVRNNIVEQSLDEGCSHLLMMDTDQVYRTPDMITRMLSHDMPVVGAPVHRRYPPFDAILLRGMVGKYKYIPDNEAYSGDLIDIDATGTGCILFKNEVFNDLDYPWFQIGTDPETGKTIGEDIGLCGRLREKGIPIRADTSIEVGHMSIFEVNRSTYEIFSKIKGFRKNI